MPKLNALIENPAAPVEVDCRLPDERMVSLKFSNLAEFERWFTPKHHKFLGSTNNATITIIGLDVADETHLKTAPVDQSSRLATAARIDRETSVIKVGITSAIKIGMSITDATSGGKLNGGKIIAVSESVKPAQKPSEIDGEGSSSHVAPTQGRHARKTLPGRGRLGIPQRVKVDGVEYRSTRQAFTLLNLPAKECKAFRLIVKAQGVADFAGHHFEIVK